MLFSLHGGYVVFFVILICETDTEIYSRHFSSLTFDTAEGANAATAQHRRRRRAAASLRQMRRLSDVLVVL